jgi:recombination DNA repair RAD52 pathway protein
MSFSNLSTSHNQIHTSLLHSEIATKAENVHKIFREMQASIAALARQLNSLKPTHEDMFALVENIKHSGKSAHNMIVDLEQLPARSRAESEKKNRTVT